MCVVIVVDSIGFPSHGWGGRDGNLVSMDDNFRYATNEYAMQWIFRELRL